MNTNNYFKHQTQNMKCYSKSQRLFLITNAFFSNNRKRLKSWRNNYK